MIVESIILENWKKFRDPVEIQFQDGLNVIHGPNESGKTTLMESLRTILFSKHSSRSRNIKAIIPFDSQLAPQAMITFRNNGGRYKVTKRFIQPMSALEKWNMNGWEDTIECLESVFQILDQTRDSSLGAQNDIMGIFFTIIQNDQNLCHPKTDRIITAYKGSRVLVLSS